MNEILFSLSKSPEDPRDYKYKDFIAKYYTFPKKLDLRGQLMPIRNQGKQGTCAAQVAACMKEYQERLESGINEYMSPQFVYNFRPYWNNNQQDGEDINEDYGMNCRDVMKILNKNGICPEKIYSYGKVEYSFEIDKRITNIAKKYIIKSYAQIETINELKKSLFKNGPCLIAFPVYNTGKAMWKDNGFESQGGHAMTIVGYNEKGFIIRNSWGKNWGDNGYCIYPYEDWGSHWEIWTTVDLVSNPKKNEKVCPQCVII